jgi:replicative DNA helicase
MNWQDTSEVVAGLILDKRLSLNAVRPEIFYGEFRNLIKYMKEGTIEPETLINKVGLDPFQSAIEAAKTINGVGDMADWTVILEQSAVEYDAGVRLEKEGRRMQMGESADWSKIKDIVSKAQEGIGSDFVPLSEVEAGKIPFTPTGWKPIDVHLGGLPSVGMIVVGGSPGVGKTTWMVKLASNFVKRHPKKRVAIFSIEMVLEELAGRFADITNLKKEDASRIMLDDTPVTPEQAINKAATIDNLGLMITDFADLMIRGETNESSMAHIYREYMIGAKELRVPNVLLSQLNRKYQGGIPRPHHIRYTSLVEALAWMLLMLYNPSNDFYAEDDEASEALPIIEERAYMVAWKVRGGFRKHKNDCPGAVQIPFRGDKGWSDREGRWFSLKKYS